MEVVGRSNVYFDNGDIILQLRNFLFKVHRDVLRKHSGFFSRMLSTPTNDPTEGTESNPIVLRSDLCTLKAFDILCIIMYMPETERPLKVYVFKIEHLEWVLKAAHELDMRDTQAFVLSQLELYKLLEDEAITFLRVALSYDKPLYVLIFKGLSLLAYRRQEITQQEAALLGRRGTELLAYSREKIRETLRLLLRGECLHYRGVPALLTVLREHAMDVFIQVLRNMLPPGETSVRSSKNIFAMPNVVAQCDDCVSFESARQKLFQTVFNEVVGQSILDKFPPRSTSEGQDNGPGAQANEPNPQADAQVDGLGAQTNTDSED